MQAPTSMKQRIGFLLGLVLLALSSCTNYYKRPIVIDRLHYVNEAGEPYEEKFQQVNAWHLQKVNRIQEQYKGFVIDTASRKRHHKMNYTLEALLQPLEVDGKPGLYYNLYLRPNSGIGRLEDGKVMDNMYNELKLYSPETNFFRHGQVYHSDSVIAGALNKIRPVHEWLTPQNTAADGTVAFALDSLIFPRKLNRRQKDSIRRMFNNAFVERQKESSASRKFDFYPNFRPNTAYQKADVVILCDVTDSPETNQIRIKLRHNTEKQSMLLSNGITINRQDFLNGHYYEAAYKIREMVNFSAIVLHPKSRR